MFFNSSGAFAVFIMVETAGLEPSDPLLVEQVL